MQFLLDKHGTTGTDAYMRLLEYAAKHFDVNDPGTYLDSQRHLFSILFPLCCKKTGKLIIETFQGLGLAKFSFHGKSLKGKERKMSRLNPEFVPIWCREFFCFCFCFLLLLGVNNNHRSNNKRMKGGGKKGFYTNARMPPLSLDTFNGKAHSHLFKKGGLSGVMMAKNKKMSPLCRLYGDLIDAKT